MFAKGEAAQAPLNSGKGEAGGESHFPVQPRRSRAAGSWW